MLNKNNLVIMFQIFKHNKIVLKFQLTHDRTLPNNRFFKLKAFHYRILR